MKGLNIEFLSIPWLPTMGDEQNGKLENSILSVFDMCSPSNVGENLTTEPEMCSTTALSEPAKANRHNNVGLPLRMAIHNLELKIISGSTSINKLNPTANNKLRIPMFKTEMPIEVKLHTTLPVVAR